MTLTVKQYQSAISHALSPRQIEVLQILYSFPNSTATAQELANILSPTNPATIIANYLIGKIGKAIANYLRVVPKTYYNGKRNAPAYFTFVGFYYSDGWRMNVNLRKAAENLKLVSKGQAGQDIIERLPTEVFQFDEKESFAEGKAVQVFVNRYERSLQARLKCIQHHGNTCFVCGFDFGKTYGNLAKGFIHVHHKRPLSEINKEYQVDPITDLIPVCANCHSVIHLTKPALTIEELKRQIKKAATNTLPKAGKHS